jgi:TRAP-type C4-dicarboxylate transport system permease small subunit
VPREEAESRVTTSSGRVGLLVKWVHSGSRAVCVVGCVIITAMVLMTVVDVVMRYVFNRPSLYTYEVTVFMMASIASFWIAYTASQERHVSVDMFTQKLPHRAQRALDGLTSFISAGLFALISWQSALQAAQFARNGVRGAMTHIPTSIFVYVVALGAAMLCLELIVRTISDMKEAKGK